MTIRLGLYGILFNNTKMISGWCEKKL